VIETTDDGRFLAQTLAGDNMKKIVDGYLRGLPLVLVYGEG